MFATTLTKIISLELHTRFVHVSNWISGFVMICNARQVVLYILMSSRAWILTKTIKKGAIRKVKFTVT